MPELTDKALAKLSPKETIEHVFDEMGGAKKMTEWALSNPGTFYTQLYGKLVAQSIDLNVGGGIRIDLPWLSSRPGRPPVTLENEAPSAPLLTDKSVQVHPEAAVHSPSQPDPEVRVRGVPPAKRQNRKPRQ